MSGATVTLGGQDSLPVVENIRDPEYLWFIPDHEYSAMRFKVRTSEQLGPILRRFRREKGLTQAELGRAIGLSQERVSAIERQPEKVTFDQLLTVLMALDCEFIVAPRNMHEMPRTQQSDDEVASW